MSEGCHARCVHAPGLCAPCREEAYCRFCELQLPDWADAYKSMPKGDPCLSVSHEGTVYLINGKQHHSILFYMQAHCHLWGGAWHIYSRSAPDTMQIVMIRTISSPDYVPNLDSSAFLACSKSRGGGPASLHGHCTRPIRPLRRTGARAVFWLQGAWQSRCSTCPHLPLTVLSTQSLLSMQHGCAPLHR